MVSNGNPVVIDPECILYNFDPEGDDERLLNTGFLSYNPRLSALRGGENAGVPLFEFDPYVRGDGILDYRKPVGHFGNRVRRADGSAVDPADYREVVKSGYTQAYSWFVKHADIIADILSTQVSDDFRVRYLVRKTRHYVSVIHMLNLPISAGYRRWEESVFRLFRASGHFPTELAEETVLAEIQDLRERDIPYFWINAGERVIRHKTGPKQTLKIALTPRQQAVHDIRTLSQRNLDSQLNALDSFFDYSLAYPIGKATITTTGWADLDIVRQWQEQEKLLDLL